MDESKTVDWGDVQRLFMGRRFQLALESIDYAVYLLDSDGVIRGWTHGAEKVLGYSEEEAAGRHFSIFYSPADADTDHPARQLALAVEHDRHEDEGWRLRKDGSRFWAAVTITALRDDAGELIGFVKVTRDRTEHKLRDDRLRAVLEVAQATLAGRDEAALLRLIVQRARELVDADLAAIARDDPAGDGLAIRLADGPDATAFVGAHFPEGGTPAGLGEVLTVPLASGDRRLGALLVGNRPDGRRLTASEAELIELFAAQAAVAMDYRRARDDLQRLAIVQDRERIGRELHDGAIQSLFAVGMGLQGVALLTPDAGLRERLDDAVTQIDEVIRDLRSYIFGLRPGAEADRQLSLTLHDLARQLEERHGVACAINVDPATAARLAGRAADVQQVAREALANVGRHAAAATCRLSLRTEADHAVLRIEDDGRGFVPESVGGRGWGLRNLAERAAALGGSLEITSVPGDGATVTLRVPL